MKRICLSVFLMGAVAFGNAQVKAPQPSPAASVKQTIGLSEVTVDYSRPSAKERKIFGELVPMNQVWRTGANGSTDITFGGEVVFGGTKVPAGKYALYSIPSMNEWEVILYKDTEQWGAPKELDNALVAARAKVKPENTSTFAETFEIGFQDVKSDKANLTIRWENTLVKVPLVIDSKMQVLESITKTLGSKDAKGSDYNQAASYYFETGMDNKKALEYAKKANQLQPDVFYMLKLQSEIEAANGMKKEAIATAKRSMELSQKASNADYVKMNADNIAKWSK